MEREGTLTRVGTEVKHFNVQHPKACSMQEKRETKRERVFQSHAGPSAFGAPIQGYGNGDTAGLFRTALGKFRGSFFPSEMVLCVGLSHSFCAWGSVANSPG